MKTMTATLAILAALAIPSFADEMILKDGRRILWKSVADDGENYAVETRDGKKLKVKKVEVDHFGLPGEESGPAAAPLTGAAFADQKKAIAAAAPVDILLKGKATDAWKYMGRNLVGSATWPVRATLVFDYELPEEYDLALTAERLDDGKKDLDVGIVTPTGTCAYHLDAWDAAKSCLALIGGQEGEYFDGQVFKKGKPRNVKFQVRKDGLALQLDGREVWKGKVDWTLAGLHPAVKGSEKGKPFIVAAGGAWRLSAFTVTPVVRQ